MHIWTIFWKFHSYMHEFPLVHKIHKFDHGDDLVIMAMTDCWSFMIAYIIMSSWNISWPLSWNILAQFRHVEKIPVHRLLTSCRLVVRSSGSTRVVNLPLKKAELCLWTVSHTVTQCPTRAQFGTVRCRSLWKNACRDTCSRPRDTCGDCRQSLVKGFGGIGCSQFFVFFLMNVICNMIDHPKPAPSKTYSQCYHSNVFFTPPSTNHSQCINESHDMCVLSWHS